MFSPFDAPSPDDHQRSMPLFGVRMPKLRSASARAKSAKPKTEAITLSLMGKPIASSYADQGGPASRLLIGALDGVKLASTESDKRG
jgi:hypothetical protein